MIVSLGAILYNIANGKSKRKRRLPSLEMKKELSFNSVLVK